MRAIAPILLSGTGPPPVFWLGAPLGAAVAMLSARAWDDASLWQRWFEGERGLVEVGTVVVLAFAIGWAGRNLMIGGEARAGEPTSVLLRRVFWATFALGALYFAGEEASWGQHWFGWATPEAVARWNDQGETNLHNASSWLDQKPRAVLELWVVASVIVVLAELALRRGLAGSLRWTLGNVTTLPAGLLAELARLPERLTGPGEPLPQLINVRLAEVQEFYFALFILLFAWSRARTN